MYFDSIQKLLLSNVQIRSGPPKKMLVARWGAFGLHCTPRSNAHAEDQVRHTSAEARPVRSEGGERPKTVPGHGGRSCLPQDGKGLISERLPKAPLGGRGVV